MENNEQERAVFMPTVPEPLKAEPQEEPLYAQTEAECPSERDMNGTQAEAQPLSAEPQTEAPQASATPQETAEPEGKTGQPEETVAPQENEAVRPEPVVPQEENIIPAEPRKQPTEDPRPEAAPAASRKPEAAPEKPPVQQAERPQPGNGKDSKKHAKKEKISEEKKAKKRTARRRWGSAAMLLLIFLLSAYSFRSEEKHMYAVTGEKNFSADLSSAVTGVESDSLSTVFNLPKVYILPWNEEPGPVPNENCYSTAVDENGVEVTTYEDETITVKYWVERQRDSNVYFAEVWIAHPTQLRTMLAGTYSGTERATPQRLAQKANAVVAINGDYFGYHPGGIIIRQGTKYRDWALTWDMLLIDSEGDFHIMSDYESRTSGVFEDYDIVNTLEFGPSLIIDGEINIINSDSGCGREWNNWHDSPRTAIGQIGRLHYLMCCVEGRVEGSAGVLTPEMAEIMLEKGCVQAYNLDGGMSTTMVLGGEAMNAPMWGGQRVVTEIIYFATALPNEEQ